MQELGSRLLPATTEHRRPVLHDYQRTPGGEWNIWAIIAGRGAGKSFTGSNFILEGLEEGVGRFALVGRTSADVRDVMIEGPSGIIKQAEARGLPRPTYESSRRRVSFANGAVAFLYSAEEPDLLRGPEHERAWCVAAGSLVLTSSGEVPIERVRPGMFVATREGWRRVLAAQRTRKQADVLEIHTADGHTLRLTENHRVWVKGKEWIHSQDVSPSDIITAWRYNMARLPGSNGRDTDGIETNADTTRTERADCSMLRSGSGTLANLCRRAGKCITSTATRLIAFLPTSPLWQRATMPACILQSVMLNTPGTLPTPARKHELQHASSGTTGNREPLSAPNVAGSISRLECVPGSATRIALHDSAVVSVGPSGQADVYDLTIEGAHEFFANGVLVHNCDELAAWKYEEAWDNLQFGMRIGTYPRTIVTTTPKPVPLVRKLMKRAAEDGSDVVVTRGRTKDNAANLAPSFLRAIEERYAGTRLGRQELEGELLEDVEGALWTIASIDDHRMKALPDGVDLSVVVVGVDPAATSSDASDETGIIAAGAGTDRRGYVLSDSSLIGAPLVWARKAIASYQTHEANYIIVEVNNGGEMVTQTIRTVDPKVPVKAVHASRGKQTRAEPISALYEQGHISHVGIFPQLEEQMTTWVPGMSSPDRLDALVWAFTALQKYIGHQRIGGLI